MKNIFDKKYYNTFRYRMARKSCSEGLPHETRNLKIHGRDATVAKTSLKK